MQNFVCKYIPSAQVDQPISYEWDDWDPYILIGKNNYDSEQLLSNISNYGKFVYSLGCAEWVISRLNCFIEDDTSLKYLHACWAYEVSEEYLLPVELDDENWKGKVYGPICLVLTTIINTRYGFDEDNAEIDSAFAEKVSLHVLPDKNVFLDWRKSMMLRLNHLCPISEGKLGKRLPMQILDPNIYIEPDQFSELIDESLKSLLLKNNPFI